MIGVLIVLGFMFISDPYVGLSIHAVSKDSPMYEYNNPQGLFGGELDINKNIKVYTEHKSSIDVDDGYGTNSLGIKYFIK